MFSIKKLEHKFVGYNTLNGNRLFSINIFYKMLFRAKRKYKLYPYIFFFKAYENLAPLVVLRKETNRRGQIIKEVPFKISNTKRLTTFLLWSLKDLKGKIKRKFFFRNLLRSIFSIYENKGSIFFKKKELYKKSAVGKFNIIYFKA